MSLSPYIFFHGDCQDAILFYQQALGAELLYRMTFGERPDAPDDDPRTTQYANKILYANLRIAGSDLMLSDDPRGDTQLSAIGYALALATHSEEQGKRWYDNLAQGGVVTQQWTATFWTSGFGCVTDKFGIPWMVNITAATQ